MTVIFMPTRNLVESVLKNKYILRCIKLGIVGIIILLLIPIPRDSPSYSSLLYSREGDLLSATVSSEQQWCFPLDEDIPKPLENCILLFEDEYFYYHPGINPISAVKAAIQNVKSKRIVRGASTITMQVMRMKNHHSKRNIWNKLWESLSAVKYTVITSKKEVLKNWCQIAPFGGNVIGVKAAALLYFGRPLDQLSWSEYALLAILPNSPNVMHLTKNRNSLLSKRNLLLEKLYQNGYFSEEELKIYQDEDLPVINPQIKQNAIHFMAYCKNSFPNENVFYSTINTSIQSKLNDLCQVEINHLNQDGIGNLACIVMDIESNELLAYVGNATPTGMPFNYVDIVQSPRSYGSLLKTYLYLYVIDKGFLLPKNLIADIPTYIGTYAPENFDKKFRGAVGFDEMLISSLNVPAVRVLNEIGLDPFYEELTKLDLKYLDRGADYYGLSLILGGGETTMWELARLFKGFGRNRKGVAQPFNGIKFLKDKTPTSNEISYDIHATDQLLEVMSDVKRPREEKNWSQLESNLKIAWKTGTSYGHKDAWAIGVNGKYVVAVWVGNQGGEGRHNLTGVTRAAPIMFKIFRNLPGNQWFDPIQKSKNTIRTCKKSGLMASKYCPETELVSIPKISMHYKQCPYHREIYLDQHGLQLSTDCISQTTRIDTLFQLPPVLAYYYQTEHSDYTPAPTYQSGCSQPTDAMTFIYPVQGLKLFLPNDIDKKEPLVARLNHFDPSSKVYWYLDSEYLMTTESTHEFPLQMVQGYHQLSAVDQNGNKEQVHFEILGNSRHQ